MLPQKGRRWIRREMETGKLSTSYELRKEDVGHLLDLDFGQVQQVDVGKMVFLRDGILQMEDEDQMRKRKQREDRKRLNLPTQDFPPKLKVSIGGPVGGHDQRPQEVEMNRVKKLIKDISEIGMKEQLTSDEEYDLEELIDKHSLKAVLDTLADISYEKADHIRTDWQDEVAAKSWEKDAKKIEHIAVGIEN